MFYVQIRARSNDTYSEHGGIPTSSDNFPVALQFMDEWRTTGVPKVQGSNKQSRTELNTIDTHNVNSSLLMPGDAVSESKSNNNSTFKKF